MKEIALSAVFGALLASAASAQIQEQSRTQSRTQEQANSTERSVGTSRSLSPGALFFDHLAELEAVIQSNVTESNDDNLMGRKIAEVEQQFFQKKVSEGKLVIPTRNGPVEYITAQYCHIFSTRNRTVWSHEERSYSTTTRYENGKITFQEPDYVQHNGDGVTYSDDGVRYLGKPLKAAQSIRCADFYAKMIDLAIQTLEKKGSRKGRTVYVKNLKEEAELALWGAYFTQAKAPDRYAALGFNSQCYVPTAENLRKGGGKQFRCENWDVNTSPMSYRKNGVVVLDATTINGNTWQFLDTQSATSTNSNRSTNTNSNSQKANVAN